MHLNNILEIVLSHWTPFATYFIIELLVFSKFDFGNFYNWVQILFRCTCVVCTMFQCTKWVTHNGPHVCVCRPDLSYTWVVLDDSSRSQGCTQEQGSFEHTRSVYGGVSKCYTDLQFHQIHTRCLSVFIEIILLCRVIFPFQRFGISLMVV